MSRRLPPLGSLRAFEAAARRLSFRRAAEEFGVTPTAVSHQIRQLEETLGVSLFRRLPRKVALTAEGATLAPALSGAFDQMADAIDRIRERPTSRVATLSATVAFTAKRLVPGAVRFRAINPGWDLRLHASDDPVDLVSGEADAAIRYGAGHEAGLERLPLLSDSFAPVASPRLGLRSVADLGRATLIHFDWRPRANVTVPSWRLWAERAGLDPSGFEGGVTFNDENSAILAAVAGQGVALLSLPLLEAELASGLLAKPFGPELEGFRYDFVHPEGSGDRQAVAALRRWIEAEFGAAGERAR